ncbi:type IX secretion system sortase PorU [Hymenobacter sp. BT664]|uniref:Type IX secretion system sortase PorU n=1 Tax=Hymenobacter montanus TaxID=2771359 RepID=A0A927GKI7_9BACT|nr:type IX secretion system sortase PorU [Hymenobacter montanus]MBD2769602.1 type IX secretion system sortase PorU [Hymenobacter montanus]
MRLFFLFIAFAGIITGATTPARAQSGEPGVAHGIIKWGGYAQVPTLGARKQKVPTFDEAHQALDDQVGWFSLRLNGRVTEGELTNLVYEPFSEADAKLFNVGQLPTGPEPKLSSGREMKQVVTHLSLRPVRRSPQTGQPERLVSFDYRYAPTSEVVAARGTGTAARNHAPHSVLATGQWFKMGVAESGIYKLDKEALRNMGLNPQEINPNNLHVYGNSMGILPQANSVPRPDDLAENNILLVGNGNNVFEDNEYFLFYSPGAHTWVAQDGVFKHRNNIYTDTTYYFVTVNNTAGLRVPTAPALLPTSRTPTISTFTYRDFYEHDLANLLRSGRNWVGESFNPGQPREFAFTNIPDLVANAPIRVTSSLVANSSPASSFQLSLNGAALATQPLDPRPRYDFGPIATVSTVTSQLALSNPGADLRVGLTYNSSDPGAIGYLDYLEINAQRQLKLRGAQLEFRSLVNINSTDLNRFVVDNATGAVVWDVTNPRRAVARPLEGGAFIGLSDTLREYVAFQPSGNFSPPRPFGRVVNQDLHALNGDPGALIDLVIVTYPPFKAAALRLADHRTRHDNLRVAVATTTEVYNEFSSGGQDVTAIRDLMKLLYDRAPAGKQMQLLLFGDASFDYKSDPYNNKSFEPQWWKDERKPFKSDSDFDAFNQNYVPTYESRESLAPFYGGAFGQASYSSDDYYALLDDDEGEWEEQNPGTELLDIGVGRLPVRTPKGQPANDNQAQQVVKKLMDYDATSAYGKWRNRITLVSDDGDNDLFVGGGSERMAQIIQTNHPVYNVHKVYLDLYPQVAVSAGQRSPETNRAIDQSIEQGSLIVNYLGHGGPKGWADEQIVTNASVLALRNPNNFTFFTTGTCDFSTYDDPNFTSAGEQSLTDNPTGGAIGLFTTTRVVEANLNAGLNQAYFNRVLRPVNGQMPSIGTVVMLSKNDYPGAGQPGVINNRNYELLADPSMTLAYPRQTVQLDSVRQRISGQWQSTNILQALARIRIHGRLLNNGVENTAFTGRAQVTIFDKPTTVMTLGNEASRYPGDAPRPVVVQENVIYGGQAEVVNGQFSLVFVVPKDINYNVGLGKISLYASDPTRKIDAQGYEIREVGGAATDFLRDTTPPVINLFMDNESFAYGGLTGQETTLLAKLSDESGINTTGTGIGHDITAVLDRDPSKLIVLNDSYESNVGDFTSGRVKNLFKELPTGPHSLTLKAWDTYNNSAEKEIEFVVARNEKLALDHVLNYPNPFAKSTTFLFDHNQAGNVPDNLDVQVQIFTITGHLVRTLTATVASTEPHQRSITWNGRDEYDDQLARGVYVYRLSVRSQNNGSTASKYEKLVILN